ELGSEAGANLDGQGAADDEKLGGNGRERITAPGIDDGRRTSRPYRLGAWRCDGREGGPSRRSGPRRWIGRGCRG
ncbi:MAG: hypothetical protein C4307_04865, partial [Chloroflexota bacterium]